MPPPKGGAKLPKTKVYWDMITLADEHPTQGMVSFSFPRRMVAWPLSNEGPGGSPPNNKAAWWPFFQQRHQYQNNYWVQGHMLNDNIHGPGEPKNLVPITGTLNTNMLGIAERFVKQLVASGEVVEYIVEAHWESTTVFERQALASNVPAMSAMEKQLRADIPTRHAAEVQAEKVKFPKRKVSKISFDVPYGFNPGFVLTNAHAHPSVVRKNWGIKPTGLLLWGEQFAPTRLSWSIRVSKNWLAAADWNQANHAFQLIELSRGPEWNNNFPDK